MERIFQGCAVILAGCTVYFLWRGDQPDLAFAAGVLACVSFFLSVRAGARHRLGIRTSAGSDAVSAVEDADSDVRDT